MEKRQIEMNQMQDMNFGNSQQNQMQFMNMMMGMNNMYGGNNMMGGMNTSIENMSMPGMPSLSTQGIPGNQNMAMNQNIMQMMGSMQGLNPNLFAMLPPYQNYYGNNNRNMFVRKAKYPGSDAERENKRGGYSRGGRGQGGYRNDKNYGFPSNQDGNNQDYRGDKFKNSRGDFNRRGGRKYENDRYNNYDKKDTFEEAPRPRVDSDNFPALTTKVITVDVPMGNLAEMDLEPESDRLTRKQIFAKFRELKAAGAIKIAKKLGSLSFEKYPIVCKQGDIRIEELEPTESKELKVIISEKNSKNPSRKQSENVGFQGSNQNSPLRKVSGNFCGSPFRKGSESSTVMRKLSNKEQTSPKR